MEKQAGMGMDATQSYGPTPEAKYLSLMLAICVRRLGGRIVITDDDFNNLDGHALEALADDVSGDVTLIVE